MSVPHNFAATTSGTTEQLMANFNATVHSNVLNDPSLTTSGDALISVVQPFAGALTTRTQHDKNQDTGLYADDFRQAADPDDTLSIQRVLNLGKTCYLRADKTYIASNITSSTGKGLVCVGGRATIQVPAGSNLYGILVNTNYFSVDGVNFDGGNMGPHNSGAGTLGTRNGILVGNSFGTGSELRGITIANCDCYGFDVAGFQGREVQIGFNFGKRVTLHNVNCYNNVVGFWYSPRFEYTVSTACYGYSNYAGLIMQAGNNSLTGCHYEWNFQNLQMVTGENDAHGQFVGCSFNHAYGSGQGLYASGIVNGESFVACAFWYAPIELLNCTGIQITNSQIVSSPITVNGGGLNCIDDNWIRDPITPTFFGTTYTSFRRNRTTAADVSPVPHYGDVYMRSTASTFNFNIGWNATTDTQLPLVFSTKKWHGVDAAFLESGNAAAIKKTGVYSISAALIFTTLGAAQGVSLKITRYNSGAVLQETVAEYADFPSGTSGCTVSRNVDMLCFAGDSVSLQVRTSTATGVDITGIDVRIRSVD